MTTKTDRAPIAYEDDEYVVLCDRENPNAWIRTDTVVSAKAVERDQIAPI